MRMMQDFSHCWILMRMYFKSHKASHLKLQPYKQNSVALRKHLKLSSKYYGPYTILQRVGQVAYKLDLPSGSKVHPVFHVSLLKKCVGTDVTAQSDLPPTTDEGVFHLVPAAVLDRREITRGKDFVSQLLIQWGNEGSELLSWEDAKFMAKSYPNFNPCGQGLRNAGGIVVGLAVAGDDEKDVMKKKKMVGAVDEEKESGD